MSNRVLIDSKENNMNFPQVMKFTHMQNLEQLFCSGSSNKLFKYEDFSRLIKPEALVAEPGKSKLEKNSFSI